MEQSAKSKYQKPFLIRKCSKTPCLVLQRGFDSLGLNLQYKKRHFLILFNYNIGSSVKVYMYKPTWGFCKSKTIIFLSAVPTDHQRFFNCQCITFVWKLLCMHWIWLSCVPISRTGEPITCKLIEILPFREYDEESCLLQCLIPASSNKEIHSGDPSHVFNRSIMHSNSEGLSTRRQWPHFCLFIASSCEDL